MLPVSGSRNFPIKTIETTMTQIFAALAAGWLYCSYRASKKVEDS